MDKKEILERLNVVETLLKTTPKGTPEYLELDMEKDDLDMEIMVGAIC